MIARRWPSLVIALVFACASGSTLAQRLPTRDLDKLAKDWFGARPPTLFERWDPELRAELEVRAAELGALPEGKLSDVVEILWKQVHKNAPAFKGDEFDTPFGEATWIEVGKGGPKAGLLLGIHGGGENAGSANNAAAIWTLRKHLCLYPQGIRLVGDTWLTVHGERFMLTLIELAKAREEVDPDRIYVAGFSMGGTGSWFLAGRHPDLLAGAIPAHGVIMAAPRAQLASKDEVERLQHGLLPNVRNLAMYWYTGDEDTNCRPGTFLYAWDRVQELRAEAAEREQGGWELQRFELHPGLAHDMPEGEPAEGLEWITAQRRDTFPTRLTWEYAADPFPQSRPDDPLPRLVKHFYYWLHCDDPRDLMRVEAEREGNTIRLTTDERVEASAFTVLLNDEMIDVEQDVRVEVDGEPVYTGRPAPDYATVFWTLDARLDQRMVFDRAIRIP